MKRPSTSYLYGFTNTFGVGVNPTQAEADAVDAAIAAEQKAHAADCPPVIKKPAVSQ